MRLKAPAYFAVLAIALLAAAAWADQITLKDGTMYSGRFVRGDSKIIEFRILGRIESFQTAEIAQIVFEEPEAASSGNASSKAPAPVPVRSEAAGSEEGQMNRSSEDGASTRSRPVLSRASSSVPPQPEPSSAEDRPRRQITKPEPAAQEGVPSSLTVPAGMAITVRTATEIDTERNRVGDTFDAVLEDDLLSGTQVAVPRGALIKGRIAYAQESGKLSGQSQLILELIELAANGKTYPVRTSDYTEVGASRGTRTAQTVGGVAAVGAIIGAIAGGGKGAAIGAASGAAVGTGVQVITRGQILRIPIETILEFKLQSPLVIQAP
ncbi:MAG: hypothetical protein JXA73_03900 [Acidobacteria bacterium]|nr:hypothetical protein [Acidobacteriota bacterium]